jgi:hypothetical protein
VPIGGGASRVNGFFVEMVLEELDAEGEFFYSDVDRKLYVKPNTTSTTEVAWQDQVEIYSPKNIHHTLLTEE